jgi:hypothetical protein
MVLTKDKYIIIGIFLLLTAILILVGFNLNRGGSIIENFQTSSLGDLTVDDIDFTGDANLFQALNNSENYLQKNHEIKNEMHVYNKDRISEVINSLQNNQSRLHNLNKSKQELKSFIDNNPPNIIRTLKSQHNNQMLTVQPYDLNSYQVQINDKCLTVYDDNKYLLDNCNTTGDRSDTQKFSTHRIRDMLNAKSIMGRAPNKIAEYPYNIFKSDITGQCLTIDDEGVSVQKCLPDNDKQHFKVSDQQVLCSQI